MGVLLAILAFALAAGTGWLWFQRMNEVRTGEVRALVMAAMAGAVVLAIASLASSPGLLGGLLAAVTLLAAGLFLGLQPLSGQAPNVPAVEVGGPILDFTAMDDAGQLFRLETLHGRPFLLKFFRGHW